jgi:mono/diheme cytochrome c family protein
MTSSTVGRRLAAGATIALALSASGCGGSSHAQPASGQELFAAECSACHSLSGSEQPRLQGGDLRGLRVSHAAMLQFVREMPVRHHLTAAENEAVTKYVLAIERAARGGSRQSAMTQP